MPRPRLGYDDVALVAPVTVPYVRYSIRAGHWFVARALAMLLERSGLAKTEVDGACISSFTLAPDSAIGLMQHIGLSPRWLDDSAILPGALQLSQLYVAADWHGRGVAQALIDWTIADARRRAATALVLTVWEENFRALRFYVRNGFVHIGDYAFPTGTQIDRDLIMQLAL